ncbi:Peptidase M35 deuterolysin [Penicillium concentricum]|uniref:Neutral protease 2 n=1 Tax=Penicillium concentricum TaxID=293559 RepID=A0A9W9SRD4_9EURO|nr:Peptidase M35 deuterolysin [Penicillium concentricum]KAJ5383281.1 Peptidase M35 deuterolysin [Penicillium concentricum]
MQFTFALLTAAALLTPVYSNGITPMSRRETGLKLESCTTSQQAVVEAAVQRAASLAKAAADAAINGDASIFEEYFRTTDTASRQEVAARYEAIANEASNLSSGKVTYNCGNGRTQSDCGGSGVLAYVSGNNRIFNCPDWYKIVPAIDDCGGTDQALAMVHELSHISDVYSPPTQDFAYKYNALVKLPKEQAVLNADTYNLYAGGEFCFIPLPIMTCDSLTDCIIQPSILSARSSLSFLQELSEEWFAIGAAALARGYNFLAFDGPGRGAAIRRQHLHFRPDWENVLTPVVDYALTRTDIDVNAIVIFGWSMGGYLVARGAMQDHRAQAIILDDGVYDFGSAFPPN